MLLRWLYGSVEIYLILDAFDQDRRTSRLEKELKEAQSHIERLEKLLSGDFANKAPAHVIQKEREKLEGYRETAEKLKASWPDVIASCTFECNHPANRKLRSMS